MGGVSLTLTCVDRVDVSDSYLAQSWSVCYCLCVGHQRLLGSQVVVTRDYSLAD